jgi:hypothetical protein
LSKLEAELIGRSWEQVRPGLDVKLLAHEGELYVQAQSQDRVSKERAMRRRRLRKLWNRLCELQKMKLNTRALLIKIGEAKKEAGRAFGLIDLKLPIRAGRKRESRKGKSPKLNLTLVSELTAPSFAKPTGAKANTCCGATLLSKSQPCFGNITPSSRKSRKPSKI